MPSCNRTAAALVCRNDAAKQKASSVSPTRPVLMHVTLSVLCSAWLPASLLYIGAVKLPVGRKQPNVCDTVCVIASQQLESRTYDLTRGYLCASNTLQMKENQQLCHSDK